MDIDKFWLLKWIDLDKKKKLYSFGCENYIKFVSMRLKVLTLEREKEMKDA